MNSNSYTLNEEAVETLKSIDLRLKRLNNLNLHYEFIKGLIYGLGFIFGTTLLLAVTILILRQFITVPVIGNFVNEIINVVEKKPNL